MHLLFLYDNICFLHLSEVLKQVWDLSDQDNDSMLSLKEFCTALYLMERYREGCPLPAVLPNSLRFDETLLLSTGQHSSAYSGSSWQQNPGSFSIIHENAILSAAYWI